MNIDRDLEKIALQEKRLKFKHFDSEVAWALGTALKAAAEKRHVAVAIDIQLNGHTLFSYSMTGTTPDNWDWIRRKRNVVLRYHCSSFAIGLKHARAQTTLQEKPGLELKDFAAHGGGFPILLEGTGCIGTITVSGLPQREDHALVIGVASGVPRSGGRRLGARCGCGILNTRNRPCKKLGGGSAHKNRSRLIKSSKQAPRASSPPYITFIVASLGRPRKPSGVKAKSSPQASSGPSSRPFPFTIPSSSAPDPTAVHRCMEGFSCRHRQGTRAGGLLQLHGACRLHPHEFEGACPARGTRCALMP